MQLNHVANRVDARHLDTIVEMFGEKLGLIELHRTERSVWLRQPGANIDLQFSRSPTTGKDEDKLRSQFRFSGKLPVRR